MMTMMTRHDHHYKSRAEFTSPPSHSAAPFAPLVWSPAKPAMLGVVDSGQLRHRVPKRLAQVRGRARSRSRRAQALTTH